MYGAHKQLWDRQGGLCYYCGELMVRWRRRDGQGQMKPNAVTIDHYIPKSIQPKGGFGEGTRQIKNLVLACFTCNQGKGDRLPENWDGKLGPWQLTVEGSWIWVGG